MSIAHPDWWQMVNEILAEHEERIAMLEGKQAAVHVYGAGTPWPDVARLQIDELQATVAAQTATINRLLERLEYLELFVHRHVNDMAGDGK